MLKLNTQDSFSTLDLEVDSRGNPRVVYAFRDNTKNNVYFNYSDRAGAEWKTPIVVNDINHGEGQDSAFPRMVIDDRDQIFVSYVRGVTKGGTTDDVMLAKVNKNTNPYSMVAINETGGSGGGGIRLSSDLMWRCVRRGASVECLRGEYKGRNLYKTFRNL